MDKIAEDRGFLGEKKENSPQELFKLSFRFSQGELATQEEIIGWFVGSGFLKREDFKATPAFIDQMKLPKQHIDRSNPTSFLSTWNLLARYVTNENFDTEALEKSILRGMIGMEEEYQRRGREGRLNYDKNTTVPDSMQDKYASLIHKYIVLGNSSGNKIMDDLLSKLRNKLDESPEEISKIAAMWESNHPGLKF